MANPWITHLMNTRKTLPRGTSLKDAMFLAKKTYKNHVSKIMPILLNKTRQRKRKSKFNHKKKHGHKSYKKRGKKV